MNLPVKISPPEVSFFIKLKKKQTQLSFSFLGHVSCIVSTVWIKILEGGGIPYIVRDEG